MIAKSRQEWLWTMSIYRVRLTTFLAIGENAGRAVTRGYLEASDA